VVFWDRLSGLGLPSRATLNYFAVSGNSPSLWWFFNEVRWLWLRSLRRRSQKAFLNWETFTRLTNRFFPPIIDGAREGRCAFFSAKVTLNSTPAIFKDCNALILL
jgi:hypothetical protein